MSGPLDLPRTLAAALSDIRRIAEGMSVLPELRETLASIDRRVETLNEEVARMRRGVEAIDGSVEPLAREIAATRAGIDDIGPHLEEMQHTLRPLQRIARRARGRRDVEE